MTATETATDRLPMPDWSRPGETWRVEPEPFMEACDDGFICGDGRGCSLPAVALVGRGRRRPICEYHMRRDTLAWIEEGVVVSWKLSPGANPQEEREQPGPDPMTPPTVPEAGPQPVEGHWYFISIDYCDVGGHEFVTRERRAGPRPEQWEDRHEITHIGACYDCQYEMFA